MSGPSERTPESRPTAATRVDVPGGDGYATYDVRRCATQREFTDLGTEWNRLLALSTRPALYLTHEWISSWWNLKKSASRELFVLVATVKNELRGIAPFVKITRGRPPFGLKRLELMAMERYAYSPRNFSGSLEIIAAEPGAQTVDSIASYLSVNASEWDYIRMHPVPAASGTISRFSAWAQNRGYPYTVRPVLSNAVITLPARWEDYLSSRSANFRKKLRYVENTIVKEGGSRTIEVTSSDDVNGLFEEMIGIESRSWKHSGGISLATPAIRAFFEAQVTAANEQGRLSLWFLEKDGKKIAYDLGITCGASVEILKGSFDRAYSRYSPGMYLTLQELRAFTQRGLRRVNLLWGDLNYKRRWADTVEQCCEMYVCNRTLAGRAFYGLCIASNAYRGLRYLRNLPDRRSR